MPSNPNSHASGTKLSKQNAVKTTTNTRTPTEAATSSSVSANPMISTPKVTGVETTSRAKNSSVVNGAQSSNVAVNQRQGTTSEKSTENGTSGVNKKKQKRRQKQAARLAAEQSLPTTSTLDRGVTKDSNVVYQESYEISDARVRTGANGYGCEASYYDESAEGEDMYVTDDEGRLYHNQDPLIRPHTNGHSATVYPPEASIKAKKKKKNKTDSTSQPGYSSSNFPVSPLSPTNRNVQPPPPPPPPLSTAALRSAHHISKDRIWNTSTAEERERIKEFWLSLGEEDRRSLVKVEKEAVLKKMKEQQKHSCSCTVCGRKRTAIEEELEVLYDAYYEELEQYANNQHISLEGGTPIVPHQKIYAHPMSRMAPTRNPQVLNGQRPSASRIQEIDEDDEEGDDEGYSDEDEDEELSEDEPQELPPGPAADFFNFGNSLTVQGGILTVADDLLKNDGKKFIEMMEQLAERRMQREEEAQYAAARLGHPSMQSHNHGSSLDDDGYDDDEDEEYDSQEDEDFDEDEMETLTEEQRMEEGRRMFQIFAARMFEQRVLTAYREKVANERQQKLIEELEEESRLDTQREAKKAKEAQKRKDKKRQQKQVKDEEKAKREAEKAAEEAEAKALEERKAEEQRQKKEEQRKRKEAEKKAQDEERQRKEAEKQKRLQEAREQQAELERKQREQKEKEKKKRDEVKRKEREEREAKEKDLKDKKDREAAEKKAREAKAKSDREAAERSRKEDRGSRQHSQIAPALPVKHQNPLSAIPSASVLQPSQTISNHASPHLQIATPVVPKAPTPVRPRQTSFQGSHNSSPKTSHAPSGSSTTSPSVSSLQQNGTNAMPARAPSQPPQYPIPTSTVPTSTPIGAIAQPSGFSSISVASGSNFSPIQGSMLPPMTPRAPLHEPVIPAQHPQYPQQPQFHGNNYRGFVHPNGMSLPPGINMMRSLPTGRGAMDLTTQAPPISSAAGGINNVGPHMPLDAMPSHSHSRHTSASYSNFDIPSVPAQTQPIARPTPIHRPSSVAPGQQAENNPPRNSDIDDLSNHLGSSALLDDTDIPLSSNPSDVRRGSLAPGTPLTPRHTFTANGGNMDTFLRSLQGGNANTWGAQTMPFGSPGMPAQPQWSVAPGSGWSNFGVIGGPNRPSASRAVTIRLLVCQACTKLSISPPTTSKNGFHSVESVLRQVEAIKPGNEGPVSLKELLDICDTEGNAQNGGGSFTTETHDSSRIYVKFEPGRNISRVMRGVPGEIGSPVPPFYMPAHSGARASQPAGGLMSPSGF